jgi:DNA-binding IclR family transcriptional regulator
MVERHVQSLERALDITMALANGPRTLTEVARATGLKKGTAYRLLSTLGYLHMVIKLSSNNVYVLGPGVLRLVNGSLTGVGAFVGIAKEPLEELWRQTGETICIHVRVGMDRICVHELAGTQPVRYVAEVGATASLTQGSASKVLLAFADPIDVARIFSGLGESEGVNLAELKRELESIRNRGWAESVGERIAGAAAVSVPFYGVGELLMSLSVLGPLERLPSERRSELAPSLRKAAEQVQELLLRTETTTLPLIDALD